ncbi:hypothetical protein ACTFIV_010280 [Dictyostelium citrinum]
MNSYFLFYFFLSSIFFISFSKSQTNEEYNCLANIFAKFNLSISYPKNLTGGYTDVCTNVGISCSKGVVVSISINALVERPPISAILTPAELSCLPNLDVINFQGIRVNTDFLFTKIGSVNSISLLSVPPGGIDITQIDRPFPSYYEFEFNNTILYSSYLNNVNKFYMQISYVTLAINAGTNFTNLNTLSIWTTSIPDLSSYQLTSVFFLIRVNSDTSMVNYAKINSSKIEIRFSPDSPSIPSFIETNRYATFIIINSPNFMQPTGFIDLSTDYALKDIGISKIGKNFNVNGEFPYIFSKSVLKLYIDGGSFKTVPEFANVTTGEFSIIGSDLKDLLTYGGKGGILDFSNNSLTGTIDESYCGTELIVSNNQLTGTIPTCFTCYFQYSITPYMGKWSKVPFYNRFSNNQFSNYILNPGCTTFAPQARVNSDLSGYIISGTDIGFEGSTWRLNNTIPCSPDSFISGGEINCKINQNKFKDVKYATISFPYHNKNYTFAFISSAPHASVVSVSENTLTIEGTYFSTYLGQSIQTVKVANVDCIINSTDFFKIVCTTVSAIPSTVNFSQLLTISNANETKKFLIQTSNGFINSITCPNNCSDNPNGICDLSTGECIESFCPIFNSLPCNGSPNTCNIITGICNCISNYQGSDCTIPSHYITSVIPCSIEGGEVSIFGWFGNDQDGTHTLTSFNVTIGILDCIITSINQTLIKCNLGASTGTKDIKIINSVHPNVVFNGNGLFNYQNQIKSCPNSCTSLNNGICNTKTGECQCNDKFSGFDCSFLKSNPETPKTNSSVNNGDVEMNNQDIIFEISIISLNEISFDGSTIIKSHQLKNNWLIEKNNRTTTTTTTTTTKTDSNLYRFSQELINNTCTITYIIEEIKLAEKSFTFGTTTFKLEKGSIKLSVLIKDYQYQSSLNTLQLVLFSAVDINSNSNDCNKQELSIDTSNLDNQQNLNYIQISKNSKTLVGRFINQAIVDSRSTFISNSIINDNNDNSTSIKIGLNLPHCNECLIDPDFSLLVNPNFKESCDQSSHKNKWLVPVAVVVSVVGFAIIVVISVILYKKNKYTLKITLETKLKILKK